MTNYSDAIKLLKENDKIAVFMHINPDGDCISSALSLYLFLKKLGKNVVCFSQNFDSAVISEKLRFLPKVEAFNAVAPAKEYDLCVGVDVADAGRLGDQCFRLFMKGKRNLVIDHHLPTTEFSKNVIRESDAASTTQIIYKILKQFDKKLIDDDIATCLYTGLVTDSGCFGFSSTTSETHVVASELLKYDINPSEIVRRVIKDVNLNVFRLKNRVLDKAEFYQDGKLGVITFLASDFTATNTTEKDTDGIINALIDVTQVELAVSVSEIADKSYKVSFRSKHTVDASACARCFGGGGHFHAAGCRVYGYFEDVKNNILDAVKEIMSYA